VSGYHLAPVANSFLFLQIIFRQFRVCYYGASSLDRGRVCNLQCFLVSSEQSFSGPCYVRLVTKFYYLNFDTPQSAGLGSRIYFPQEQNSPVINAGIEVSCFLLFLVSQWLQFSVGLHTWLRGGLHRKCSHRQFFYDCTIPPPLLCQTDAAESCLQGRFLATTGCLRCCGLEVSVLALELGLWTIMSQY
jgi:hypothetical protein